MCCSFTCKNTSYLQVALHITSCWIHRQMIYGKLLLRIQLRGPIKDQRACKATNAKQRILPHPDTPKTQEVRRHQRSVMMWWRASYHTHTGTETGLKIIFIFWNLWTTRRLSSAFAFSRIPELGCRSDITQELACSRKTITFFCLMHTQWFNPRKEILLIWMSCFQGENSRIPHQRDWRGRLWLI